MTNDFVKIRRKKIKDLALKICNKIPISNKILGSWIRSYHYSLPAYIFLTICLGPLYLVKICFLFLLKFFSVKMFLLVILLKLTLSYSIFKFSQTFVRFFLKFSTENLRPCTRRARLGARREVGGLEHFAPPRTTERERRRATD